ncbi:MAG: hypothetical protein QOH55_798 [Microbacteriaceae bacterium]|jgi:hypothetical protein|nr:hypothetical protein [Microbacteriaceae bacterium]MDQ1609092.1 hypothetical protein [Microbacteriaceae bacterium]
MTIAVPFDHHIDASRSRHARARGLDRVIIRLGLAMLEWARRRADRSALTHEEATRLVRLERERQNRENAALLVSTRLL